MLVYRYVRVGKISITLSTIIACLIIAINVFIRLELIFHNWPTTNSDEATVGLMALHILHGRDFPVYLYGQGSLGSLEAYIGAILFFVSGPSVIALRLGVLLLYVVFLICIYLLVRLLYSEGLALVTLALLGIGTPEILYRAIPAFAGHAETPLFVILIMLISTKIGLASQVRYQELASQQRKRFIWLYALWGFVAGVAYWNDPLASSFILMAGIFLLVCCRGTLRKATLFAALVGLLIGILPVLLNDFTAPFAQKSITSVGFLIDTGGPIPSDSLFARLAAAFLVTLPVSTGGTGVCTFQNAHTDPWPVTLHSSPYILQCTAAHGIWSLVMVATWAVAVGMELSITEKWKFRKRKHSTSVLHNTPDIRAIQAESPPEPNARVLSYARLMLLGSAALTWLVFALSAQSISNPWANNRYLIGLTAATPALLWPLWCGLKALAGKPLRPSPALLKALLSAVIMLCFFGALVAGTVDTFNTIPPTEAGTKQEYALADTLVKMHLKHIYAGYWTCDLVTFLTREQVVCSVLDEQLAPGVNRYTPYVSIVASDPKASYVFPTGSAQAQAFTQRVAHKDKLYKITRFDNYIIYQPE